jgi:fused signal recognition particle receptor
VTQPEIQTGFSARLKGGIAVAAAGRFGIPIRYLGLGEGAEYLAPFEAGPFAEALVG